MDEGFFRIVPFPPVPPDLFTTSVGITKLEDEGGFPWWTLTEGCWFRNTYPHEQPPFEIMEKVQAILALETLPDALMLDYLLWYARERAGVVRHSKPDVLNAPEVQRAVDAIWDTLPAIETLQKALQEALKKMSQPKMEAIRIALKAIEELPPPAIALLRKEFLKGAAIPARAKELRESFLQRGGYSPQQYEAYLNEMKATYFALEGADGILDRMKRIVGILDIAESMNGTTEKWALADGLKAIRAILRGHADSVRLQHNPGHQPSSGVAELVDGFGQTALSMLGEVPTIKQLGSLLKLFVGNEHEPSVKKWRSAANSAVHPHT